MDVPLGTSDAQQQYGDIIKFYNELFLAALQTEIIKVGTSSRTTGPTSPGPSIPKNLDCMSPAPTAGQQSTKRVMRMFLSTVNKDALSQVRQGTEMFGAVPMTTIKHDDSRLRVASLVSKMSKTLTHAGFGSAANANANANASVSNSSAK